MQSIIIHHDPSGIGKREVIPVEVGDLISDFIMNRWPDELGLHTAVYLDDTQEYNLLFKFPHDAEEAPDHMMCDGDVIHIVRTPEEVTTIIAVAALVIGVASAFLLRPTIPVMENPDFTQAQESPNNKLTGQTNIARPLQRIPDVFGKNRVWPDLIAPSYFEFINHVKFQTNFMCVGRGEFDIINIKSGDTLIDDIQGSSATFYGPNTGPTVVLKANVSNEVDGQELAGADDSSSFNITNVSVNYIGSAMNSFDYAFNQFSNMTTGDTFTIANSDLNNGVYTFQDFSFELVGTLNPRYVYTVLVSETFTTDAVDIIDITSAIGKKSAYGPFTVPDEAVDEIWIDIQAPKGLQLIDGVDRNTVIVDFDITIQEINNSGTPIGAADVRTRTIQDNTQDPRFYTFKFIPAALTTGTKYEVTVERTSNTVNDSTKQIFDLTKWTRLAGITDISEADYGDVTTSLVTRKATEQATSIQQDKINVLVERKLNQILSNGSLSGAKITTSRFSDAVVQHLFDAGKPLSEIDTLELYDLWDSFSNGDPIYGNELGQFAWTFSSANTPVAAEIDTILNAARCMQYREGNLMRFVRDDIRPDSVAVFNARVKAPAGESKVVKFFKPGDHDGVELRWIEADTNDPKTILLPAPNGGSNNLKVDAAGIKKYKQAWNRTQYELDRLTLQRVNVSTSINYVGGAGILPRINDRIDNVDGTNVSAQGGEIIDFTGLIVETNQEVIFSGPGNATVVLRSSSGTISTPLAATMRVDGRNGFVLAAAPPFPLFKRDGVDQVGMIYSAFTGIDGSNHNANAYLIAKMDPKEDGYIRMVLVNYREEIYDADTTTPPAQT